MKIIYGWGSPPIVWVENKLPLLVLKNQGIRKLVMEM